MSLQEILNRQALDKLTIVRDFSESLNAFDLNQLHQFALREMINSSTAIVNMNEKQKTRFQEDLIERFKFDREHLK